MDRSVDVLSEEIDELLIYKLELMEKKIRESIQMEASLKDGHIELAKARYICGKENIGILQIPNNEDRVTSMFNLETKVTNENNDTLSYFDVSLKKSSDIVDEPEDPIKWFGVLVPQNLKNSQKRFQEAIYLAAELANTQIKLDFVLSKLQKLYGWKKN